MVGTPVGAQTAIEKLVMPGPLIHGHAKLESACSNCHLPFSQQGQVALCLDCHKPIAQDIASKRGFHGLRTDVAAAECRHCHAEHKGRDADIVQFDRDLFDHATTNFALVGRHKSPTCESCHIAGKKFREAKSGCIDCHGQASPHKGQLGEACASCHTPNKWAEIKDFDHDKTKFALTGGHRETSCKSCHAGERYKGVPSACVECHRQQDVHKGRNGAQCAECHKTTRWIEVSFDHDAQTKFPLIGKHRDTDCAKCHTESPRNVRPATTCISCHRKDDAHKGQLGEACMKCHGEGGWKSDVKFDHALSRFPLQGKHAEAKCTDCHKTKAYKDAATTCSSCHTDSKSHDGRLGTNCGLCHGPSTWKQVRFDHDRQTHFRLTGQHVGVACYSCHTNRHGTKASAPTDCYSCHKKQDRHRGAFGRDCGRCHTPATFGVAHIRR